jgi:hypothetical protein
MKTLLLIVLSFGIMSVAGAQDSWKLTHNGKLKLENTEEVPEKNVFSIRIADLSKKGALTIAYSDDDAKSWIRTISIVDDRDTELATNKGVSYSIPNATLKTIFKKAGTVKVYTIAVPSDPEKAALVRVRRVHLATISLVK